MLNPRLIAIQGLNFSPIQVAIQGLLAVLIDEQSNVVGGGGRARGGRSTALPVRQRREYTDADIRRLVEEKYQIIEAKRETKVEPDPIKKVVHVSDAKEKVEATSAPVLLTRPNIAIPLAIELPKLTTVVTTVDKVAKFAKAQAEAAAIEAARLEQERIQKDAKAKRDETAIVMLLMEL